MFYNNLLCFLVAIFVFSASNPPEKPWLPPVVALALLLASLWLFAAVAGRQFAAAASAGRYFRAERRLSFLAVGLFVVLVGLLDLKYYLQPLSLGDRLPVLTDIGGLAVFFLLLALVCTRAGGATCSCSTAATRPLVSSGRTSRPTCRRCCPG